ncbi:hypothetical protein HPB52_009810 [Rhipicephalus sanguineus]|uniref:Uncharacterized protein n=1 Tax=Rhipicephalus sanguineus TaxID=34632 RepID=A0A9D4QEL0_RHISA|nr:hypothetical protein HPB52_009810 [Rhipicephalus sanguineus]
MELSEYVRSLTENARQRYVEKLQVNGEQYPDPYTISGWINDPKRWPNVRFGDIYIYLVNTRGPYSAEAMKCYRSLKAYGLAMEGHVRKVLISSDMASSMECCFLKADVTPSQRTTAKPYEPWVLVKRDGTVSTAHCTCMAGKIAESPLVLFESRHRKTVAMRYGSEHEETQVTGFGHSNGSAGPTQAAHASYMADCPARAPFIGGVFSIATIQTRNRPHTSN